MDNGLQTIKLSELPEAITLNESDYSLIVQNGTSKKIKGLLLKGNAGDNGKSIEIRKTDTHIQWRQEEGQWINLVALADLKGDKGEQGGGANVDLTDYATKVWVTQQLASYYTKAEIDLSLSNKANISHTHTEYASIDHVHNYNNLTNKPTIPSKTSDLTNDSGFLTSIPSEYVTEEEMSTALSTKANKSDIPSLNGYATETFVTNKIAEASLSGGEVDLSGYATKDDLTSKVDKAEGKSLSTNDLTNELKSNYDEAYLHSQSIHVQVSDIPSKTSDLTNDSGFLTSIPSEYITETELTNKGYLTSSDVTNFATISDLNSKANVSHTHVSSEITDLSIPAKISELQNDVDFATETYVTNKIAEASLSSGEVDLSGYQPVSDVSLTTTDKTIVGAINEVNSSLSSKVEESEVNSAIASYVTEHKTELKGDPGPQGEKGEKGDTGARGAKGDKGDDGADGAAPNITVGTVTTGAAGSSASASITGTTPNLTLNMVIPQGAKGDKGDKGKDGLTTAISVNGSTYTHVNGTITLPNYPTVPTHISQLTNDSGFLTSIPSEYVTEEEMSAALSTKANKSDIPSLDGYATETYTDNAISTAESTINDSINKINKQLETTAKFKVIGEGVSVPPISGGSGVSYVHPATHPASMITGLSTVATSGSYNDLTNKPTIEKYTLPIASSTTLGGVKIGNNLSIDSNGALSAIVNNNGTISNTLNNYSGATLNDKMVAMFNDINTNHKNTPMIITLPSGIIEITQDLTAIGWTNKVFKGECILYFKNCNAIEFKQCQHNDIYIHRVSSAIPSGSSNPQGFIELTAVANLTKRGIKITDCSYNKFEFNTILGFTNAIEIYSEYGALGSFYNNIYFTAIWRCQRPMWFRTGKASNDTSSQSGWITEIFVHGGMFDCDDGVLVGQELDNRPNGEPSDNYQGLKFYNLGVEHVRKKGNGRGIYFLQGKNNAIINPRFEGSMGNGNATSGAYILVEESGYACNNRIETSNYPLNVDRVKLNYLAKQLANPNYDNPAGSYIEGDLYDTTGFKCGYKAIATPGKMVYEAKNLSSYYLNNCKASTINYTYSDTEFAKVKTSNGSIKTIGYTS